MARIVGIGKQNFESIINTKAFYIDKTAFIKEWWENLDDVTLITRPRRFGKTLTLNMVETFFSVEYADKSELFEGLSIFKEEKYRKLQGTYPVLALSFADVKESTFIETRKKICGQIIELYVKNYSILKKMIQLPEDKKFFRMLSIDMDDYTASMSLKMISKFLSLYYQKKVIILLDEYDTPMQEAFINGYWNELVTFTRGIFNSTFKTNPYLERSILTGITRISKESIFSDLNNLVVITTTSEPYADCFGFTEDEVFAALEEYHLSDKKKEVQAWYDGFSFGSIKNIYNPWSITNYLKFRKFAPYWANTSANRLVGRLLREGSRNIKLYFEDLIAGKSIHTLLDEQIVYDQLGERESAIWSLLLASGYLKVQQYTVDEEKGTEEYELALTNKEVRIMFIEVIRSWFSDYQESYNDFIKALLMDDIDAMNHYMNQVAMDSFSFFDTGGSHNTKMNPERFYHGFVLGLIVDLANQYYISSNRESGFGRYDVILEPKNLEDNGIILEFKVWNPKKERNLEETVENALCQIEEKQYDTILKKKGLSDEKIRKYGFAFHGKQVLIGRH
ncbi:MAG: AAA family ATPase [Bacilli bacterium]|nr:AAA family ATPase [Bacilli bacterium]